MRKTVVSTSFTNNSFNIKVTLKLTQSRQLNISIGILFFFFCCHEKLVLRSIVASSSDGSHVPLPPEIIQPDSYPLREMWCLCYGPYPDKPNLIQRPIQDSIPRSQHNVMIMCQIQLCLFIYYVPTTTSIFFHLLFTFQYIIYCYII